MILLKKDVFHAKIRNIEDKIPDITDLATTAALTILENKISNVSDPVKKQIMIPKYQKWQKIFYYF